MIPKIAIADSATSEMRQAILAPLRQFNREQTAPAGEYLAVPLAIPISHPETSEILGGLWGATWFSYLHVDMLFVPEILRGKGIGERLITMAEAEALRRGCHGVWLDTFSFQARGFYERLGYSVFGTIEDHPPGHNRFFMKKSIPIVLEPIAKDWAWLDTLISPLDDDFVEAANEQ